MPSLAVERAAMLMLSAPLLMLSTSKPLGSNQLLDMNTAIDATFPNAQGEPPSITESAPEPSSGAD